MFLGYVNVEFPGGSIAVRVVWKGGKLQPEGM
jgi:hypothetical protein